MRKGRFYERKLNLNGLAYQLASMSQYFFFKKYVRINLVTVSEMLTTPACELISQPTSHYCAGVCYFTAHFALVFCSWNENLIALIIQVIQQTFLLQARCAVTVFEAAGGSVGWHGSGTVGELHMRPLGDGMINFQLHDLLVSLQNSSVMPYCMMSVVQLVK